jgi:CRISPR/Cas system-associated exonuclease Cas4 (RecB family)
MTDIKEVLAQREKTHGAFEIHATVTQELKAVVTQHMLDQGRELNASMQESIDMILHKIGRVVAGNPNHVDHWDDIAGYALLISAQLMEPIDV